MDLHGEERDAAADSDDRHESHATGALHERSFDAFFLDGSQTAEARDEIENSTRIGRRGQDLHRELGRRRLQGCVWNKEQGREFNQFAVD